MPLTKVNLALIGIFSLSLVVNKSLTLILDFSQRFKIKVLTIFCAIQVITFPSLDVRLELKWHLDSRDLTFKLARQD